MTNPLVLRGAGPGAPGCCWDWLARNGASTGANPAPQTDPLSLQRGLQM